jgi:mannose-6-phosphate isomerase
MNAPVRVVNCEHFTVNILDYSEPVVRNYSFDSFVIHVCVHGTYCIDYGRGRLDVNMGDCVLIPAAIRIVNLDTKSGFRTLECFIS